MTAVTYRVEARARRLPVGWNLELTTGDVVHVDSLDSAAEAVRRYLDQRGSPIDHARVEVAVVHPAVGDAAPPSPAATLQPRPAGPEPTGLEMTLRLLSARDTTDTFADAALQVFPWITDLPESGVPRCHGQLLMALNTATQHSRYGDLEDAVHRWRNVAGIAGHPDPGVGDRETQRAAASGSGAGGADQGSSADRGSGADRTGRHFLSEYPSATRRTAPAPAQRRTRSSRTGRHRL